MRGRSGTRRRSPWRCWRIAAAWRRHHGPSTDLRRTPPSPASAWGGGRGGGVQHQPRPGPCLGDADVRDFLEAGAELASLDTCARPTRTACGGAGRWRRRRVGGEEEVGDRELEMEWGIGKSDLRNDGREGCGPTCQ